MDKREIMKLINLKKEGEYWDFKREWYSDKKHADLLHDIICMANNRSNRDAYIIIGIDEERDYSITSRKNDPHRKNTQNLVDFLRNKPFAGGIRPIVSVENIGLGTDEIDVIVVHNTNSTPFFLTQRYKAVTPNCIYTRVQDSNTPIDKSADLSDIERLWKKRFGLLSPPLERMKIYLKEAEMWEYSSDNALAEIYYNRISPEYIIEVVLNESKKGYQFYLFNQTDSRPRWYDINLYYHQTLLASLEGVSLDGGRYFTPAPRTGWVTLSQYPKQLLEFKYFIKDTMEFVIHEFYYKTHEDDERIAHDKFLECILVFESDYEKEKFKQFVKENWENRQLYEEGINKRSFEKVEGYEMKKFEEEFYNSQILKNMFIKFRS